ncbi:unnamed protein product [Urochloa humidicola]
MRRGEQTLLEKQGTCSVDRLGAATAAWPQPRHVRSFSIMDSRPVGSPSCAWQWEVSSAAGWIDGCVGRWVRKHGSCSISCCSIRQELLDGSSWELKVWSAN